MYLHFDWRYIIWDVKSQIIQCWYEILPYCNVDRKSQKTCLIDRKRITNGSLAYDYHLKHLKAYDKYKTYSLVQYRGSRGLMDRALDL